MMPQGTSLASFDLEGIQPFNQDLENDPPDRVREFKTAIREADALLIVTPEYNYSVPGVLKNAIDWASRPFVGNPLDGKPVAIMGASIGMLGTGRAQYHLRQSFVFLNMHPLNRPEVMVSFAEKRFDESGGLTDEKTKGLIVELIENLAALTRTLRAA
jgi:chromate reductase